MELGITLNLYKFFGVEKYKRYICPNWPCGGVGEEREGEEAQYLDDLSHGEMFYITVVICESYTGDVNQQDDQTVKTGVRTVMSPTNTKNRGREEGVACIIIMQHK